MLGIPLRFLVANKFIVALIFFSLLFSLPLVFNAFYLSHDGEAQVVRIAAFYKAILDGQIPPRWAGDLNYSYGLPTLNFFFPLEGYIGTIIRLFGFSLQDVFKIQMGVAFILAPVAFFSWARILFKDHVAFLGAVFYGFAPYHFLDMYVRGQLAEMLAFVFLPLVLLFVEKNIKKLSMKSIVLGGISLSLLILSHSVLSLLFTMMISAYIMVRCFGSMKNFISNLTPIFVGLSIASFFWIPALFESKYINSELFVGDFYRNHFVSVLQLFYSTWGFGPNVNGVGGLSPQIGIFHFTFALLGVVTSLKLKSKIIFFWVLVFLTSVFMSTNISSFIWENIHMVQQFQFPWRFTAVSSFAASVLVMYFFSDFFRKEIVFILVFVVLISSLLLVRVDREVNKSDEYYLSYPGTAAYHGEATTIWTAGEAGSYPKEYVEVISGDAVVEEVLRKSSFHSYKISSKLESKILDNTTYFPGWGVWVDGRQTPIEFQDPNHRGLITFNVPPGEHKIEVRFGESPIRLVADFISIIGIIGCLSMLTFRKKLDRYLSGK